ncbi:hypothetical protein C3408_23320 [Candidatus Pantoea alvi]|uniref:DUF6622 family protein n=1 Tax=Enterobacter agglomerans TaxID=549 RepID=UPI000CDDDF0A|nr:DUF6622 family protein [Pantoea agglomerans]POW53551.1 hypothetical protein C3408_23320 [Pantoea alvi]UBN52931.1 hypothetical protein LB453_13680 [Pantoea agglomerans]
MTVTHFVKDTPVWVWVLLVFLIKRGITALSDREMRIERLFILPLIFLVWGVYSVVHETVETDASLALMLVGVILGIGIGWALWSSQPRLRNGAEENVIIRAGTPLTLVLIVLLFIAKFALTASLALWPVLFHSLHYNLLFGLLSGVLDGIFWGGTLNLYISWYRSKHKAMY